MTISNDIWSKDITRWRNSHFVSFEKRHSIKHCLDLIRAKAHFHGAAEITNTPLFNSVTRVDAFFRKEENAREAYDKIEKFIKNLMAEEQSSLKLKDKEELHYMELVSW